jgi:hypothetical protein
LLLMTGAPANRTRRIEFRRFPAISAAPPAHASAATRSETRIVAGFLPCLPDSSNHRANTRLRIRPDCGPVLPQRRELDPGRRGVVLGTPANLCHRLDGSAKGNAAMAAKAAKRAADLLPLILPMKAGGASLRRIADGLNRCGVPAPRGGEWSAVAVKRILDRQV